MVQKFQDEAKQQGIELPPVLSQVDVNTGLPTILAVPKKHKEDDEGCEHRIVGDLDHIKF